MILAHMCAAWRTVWHVHVRAHVEFCMTDNYMLNVSAEGPRMF